jgi:hypothetical protein
MLYSVAGFPGNNPEPSASPRPPGGDALLDGQLSWVIGAVPS